MSNPIDIGWIVTFYSWKGGVGRSMALANTAVQLARRGARVLMVDWDLEAPGLERYFTEGEAKDHADIETTFPAEPSGLLGMLAEVESSRLPSEADWSERVHRITVRHASSGNVRAAQDPPPEIHLLASGSGASDYGNKLANFSWSNFYENHRGAEWLEKLRGLWRERYDFVLIDSRTGLTDSSGICTVQMPDVLVFVFTASGQSLECGIRYLDAVQTSRREYAYDRSKLAIIPLLSRWDGEDEVDMAKQWINQISEQIQPFTASWLPETDKISPLTYLERTRVPHLARFSFGEPLPVITHSLTDTNLPGLAYENLARILYSHLSEATKVIDPTYLPPSYTAGYNQASDLEILALVHDSVALHQKIRKIINLHGEGPELSEFLLNAGTKLYRIARYTEAEPLLRRALQINERLFTENPHEIAIILNNLGQLLKETNRSSEAEILIRRALQIEEEIFGKDHPHVSISLNNLAQVLSDNSHFVEAESMMRRALHIDEKNLGEEHPHVAIRLNNLAQLLQETNRLTEAEAMMRRALQINEKTHGKNDPEIAVRLSNLAHLLKATNRPNEAEPMIRRALLIDEENFGENHPKVAVRLNNLAQLLLATNRTTEVEPMMRRALEIDKNNFGQDHPSVALRLSNLAQLLVDTGRITEAESMMRQALEIAKKSYGEDHPNLAIKLNNLALLLKDTNRISEAEPMMRKALKIDENCYGEDHPAVATDLSNLAQLLKTLNKLSEAESMMRRCLQIDESSLGENHPNLAIRLNNLALLLDDTNRFSEAEPLMRRALKILLDNFHQSGHHHPFEEITRSNYSSMLSETGLNDEKIQQLMRQIEESSGTGHQTATETPQVARDHPDTK